MSQRREKGRVQQGGALVHGNVFEHFSKNRPLIWLPPQADPHFRIAATGRLRVQPDHRGTEALPLGGLEDLSLEYLERTARGARVREAAARTLEEKSMENARRMHALEAKLRAKTG